MNQHEGLYLDWDANTQGALTRARTSVEALRTLRRVEAEERKPTDQERKAMAAWFGWGPLTPLFKPPNGSWEKLADEVLDMLTPEQIEGARAATYSAFYTPPAIAQAVWSVLSAFGFDGGVVLDPGCGAGVFAAHAPTDTGRPVRMLGVERDPVTAAIAAMVHPGARIIAAAFEDAPVAECSVDAVVGNVPFGDVSVFDPGAPAAVRDSLHGYFVWRSIRALRPGGIALLITSRYLLDRSQAYQRLAFAEEGQFLGAIRMPNDALASGGTSVVTDIVVFRKPRAGERQDDDSSWVEAPYKYDLGAQTVNQWIIDHPDMVLGTMAEDSARGRYGRTLKVTPPEDAPKGAELARWAAGRVQRAGEVLAREARRANRTWRVDPEPGVDTSVQLADADGRKERSFHLDDKGRVLQVQGGRLAPKKNAGRELVALIRLRDAAVALLDAEADHRKPDHELMPLRMRLNTFYDAYVAEFGYLNRVERIVRGHPDSETDEPNIVRIRPQMGGFRKDPDYVTVLALEVWDDETRTGTKAPILYGRVNKPARRPDTADSPAEALALCLDIHGTVVLAEIARLLGVNDPATVPALLGDLVYEEPTAEQWVPADEYLSGNVRAKLALARRAAERDPDRFGRNVAALEKVQPKDLEPGEIRAQLGSPWIPESDVADFLGELLGRRPKVTHAEVTAQWEVSLSAHERNRAEATAEWGTERVDAYALAELHLNGQAPVVHDRVKQADGSVRNVKNQADTLAAEAKQRQLAARFADWVWEDPDRSDRLAADYNRRFNAHVLRRFDGSHLTFPGMDPNFDPYKHQRDMVYRAVCTPRTLCGHAVGGGKTATAFMTAVTLRRLGLANKPLIVVPKHLLEQVARDGRQLFPSAKILMAGQEDLKDATDRKLFAARAATGDWDAIVVTHPVFTRIPVHPRTEADYLLDKVEEYRQAIVEHDQRTGGSHTVKALEKMVATMRTRARDLLHKSTDDGLHFEQLGVDYLLIDEAHYYKALAVPVRTEGFNVRASKRAFDLHMKLRWLSARRDRCATLFTGTPVSNTMLELYVMLHYLAPDLLDELGIGSADAWAANFVSFESHVEVSPDGVSFRMKRRPSKFVNVPELRMLLAQVADIRNADELGLKRPAARYHTVVAPSTGKLRAYTKGLVARLESAYNGGRDAGRKILAVCTDGRKAAIDPELVGVGGRARKVEAVVERVAAVHFASQGLPVDPNVPEVDEEFAAYVRQVRESAGADNVLQVVFCDFGTPNDERGDQVYGKIRRGLVEHGLPARAIRFIHDYASDQAKAGLFAECRAGKVAVLLGSTDKLGVGTNVQRLLAWIHHVDAPWRPSDIEQREGRGRRPGNLFWVMNISRHVTRESFDTFMWQTLERKARFIWQVLTGQGNARVVEDIGGDGTLSAGEVKALAAGNQLLLENSEVEGELTRLRQLYGQHVRAQRRLRNDITGWEKLADGRRAEADAWAAIADVAASHDGPAAADHRGDPLDDEALVGYLGQLAKEATESGYAWRHAQLRGVRVELVAGVDWGRKFLRAKLSDGGVHEVTVTLEHKWARPTQQPNIPPALWAEIEGAGKRAATLREEADDYAERAAGAAALEGKPFAEAEALRAAEDRLADIDAQIRQAAQELVEKGGQGEAEVAGVVVDDDEPVEVHSDPVPEIPEHYRNPQPKPEPRPVEAQPEPDEPEPLPEAEAKPAPRVRPESPGEPGITYQAAWSPVEGTVTVVRDMRAGVCGPFGDYPATSREEAATVLANNGYAIAGEWTVSQIGDHWCDLVRVPTPAKPFPMPEPYNAPAEPARVKPAAKARRPRRHHTGTAGCARIPVGRQLAHAATVLGLPYEVATGPSGASMHRVDGRDMTDVEAAEYLLAGGFLAALAGSVPAVHPDRLAERGITPQPVSGSWAQLLLL